MLSHHAYAHQNAITHLTIALGVGSQEFDGLSFLDLADCCERASRWISSDNGRTLIECRLAGGLMGYARILRIYSGA